MDIASADLTHPGRWALGLGWEADAPKREVRFAPINGHRQAVSACPKSADFVL